MSVAAAPTASPMSAALRREKVPSPVRRRATELLLTLVSVPRWRALPS